jgi:SAM-dependent methyltransferase
MTMENSTSFGLHAADYRRYRPTYPAALYDFLAGACVRTERALDCATGNGQAALALAERFDAVYAFDTSRRQIEQAVPHPRIAYAVHAAEEIPREAGRFDLVAAAQAAHWFDLPAFWRRLEPLLEPRAVVAVWGYSHCRIRPDIDALVHELLLQPIEPFWAAGHRVITEKYEHIPFPFTEIPAPRFVIEEHWDRAAFFGYVRTLSAHKRYVAEVGDEPLHRLEAALAQRSLWPSAQPLDVEFDVCLRVGRHS